MIKKKVRKHEIARRHVRLRERISGTAERPRLAVFRSQQHIYAQVIDDVAGTTLVSASTLDAEVKSQIANGRTVEAATAVGKAVAQRAKAKGIESVVYDRGGFLYHGRIAALAEGAREGGLSF
ncbi:50S ribosomal protein L18 [bacterium]|nr:50S ribosomal protein L18 [bacterium]